MLGARGRCTRNNCVGRTVGFSQRRGTGACVTAVSAAICFNSTIWGACRARAAPSDTDNAEATPSATSAGARLPLLYDCEAAQAHDGKNIHQ